jgi:2'-hydroxyisoflavone reductase
VRLLVLGGTKFVGRRIVEAALERGHDVAVFNRGQTNPGLFPAVEELRGDRLGDLSVLQGREWDAVVDTSAYFPRAVQASAELLAAQTGWYGFTSTLAVYADFTTGPTEASPTQVWDGVTEDRSAAYGSMKTAGEQIVERTFGERGFVARCGVIAGRDDPTYRVAYWVDRVAEGGDVLVPEPRDGPVQFLDARDLGDWLVTCAERGTGGIYNATGPAEPLTMEAFLEACREVSGSDARLVWADADFLTERRPWLKGAQPEPVRGANGEALTIPLFMDPPHRGLYEADISRALAAGFRPRPVEDTIRDVLDWSRSGGATGGEPPAAGPWYGLRREDEQALLQRLAGENRGSEQG